MKPRSRHLLVAAAAVLMSDLALAREAASNPYAALPAMSTGDLASLNGREAVLVANQNQEAHTGGEVSTAGGDVQGGESTWAVASNRCAV